MNQHNIVFISESSSNEIPGVQKLSYRLPKLSRDVHDAARDFDEGMRRAEAVYQTAILLDRLKFKPDIIIGHHGWGELLNLCDLWPDVPMLGYFEFYYQIGKADVGFDPEFPVDAVTFSRIRARNAINHLALNLDAAGQTPTNWQRSTYPLWARPKIDVIREGVDLDLCRPVPMCHQITIGAMIIEPTDKLVTYVARDLEPYRGFHIIMRALPHLLRARRDIKVVLIGGKGVSYGSPPPCGGTWYNVMLREMGDQIDQHRVTFVGKVAYDVYLTVLRRSDAHVYLTYPFVASWSLREALAIGCPVIGSDTEPVREFITHGHNGCLVPFLDPTAVADQVLAVLADQTLTQTLRANARDYAERQLALSNYLATYDRKIEQLTGMKGAEV